MSEFDIIEVGFDNADETINFGSRSMGYDNLYDISTIACLKSSEESKTSDINVYAETKNGRTIISINNSLKIFQDTDELIFNVSLEADIVSFASCENGRYVVLCLLNGFVSVLDVEHVSSSIFSECLFKTDEREISFIKCFPEEFSSELLNFLIVLSSGNIFRIYIKKEMISEELTYNCSLEKVIDLNSNVVATTFLSPFLATAGSAFCIYNVRTLTVLTDSLGKFKTIAPFGHYILSLDEDGYLNKICPRTLLMFPVDYEHLVEELTTIEDQQRRLILLSLKKYEQGNSFLQLLNADLSRIFSIKITDSIFLTHIQKTTDDIMFLSAIHNTENFISEVRIQRVNETQPEVRIIKLIRKQKFHEAEKIAEMFNIDPVIILKAKVDLIVEQSKCTTEDVTNLLTLMDSIKDDKFNLLTCLGVNCICLEDVRKLLNYGIKIVPKCDESKQLKKVLSDSLFKFDTFMALSDDLDRPSWSKFSNLNLIEAIKYFLKTYHIEDAIIIYNRLDSETIVEMTTKNIEEILQILINLPTNVSQPFLSTFIPLSIMHKPVALSIFVQFLYNRILELEKTDSNNFPANGILLAESILKLMRVDTNSCISFQRHRALNKEGIDELANLMEGLRNLEKLKKEHKLNVPLKEYLQGPDIFVKYLLNVTMPPNDYEHFVKEFLYIYLLQNQFEPDKLFFEQIIEFIDYDDCCVYMIEILLKYMSCVEKKLLAVKELLEKMPVPWNNVVKKIAKNCLHYSHPLTTQIKDIFNSEERLIVLSNPKYNVKNKKFTDLDELTRVIERIIYINESNFLEDIYHICRSSIEISEATKILFIRLVLQRNIDKAFLILDKCTKQELYTTAKFCFGYAESVINSQYIETDDKDAFYKTVYPLYRKLKRVGEGQIDKELIQQKLNHIRAAYIINKNYGRNHISHEFDVNARKMEIFHELVEDVSANIVQDSLDIEQILNITKKLAECFMLEKDYLLLNICDKIGNMHIILNVAKHLYETESTSKYLCQIVVLFLKYLITEDSDQLGASFGECTMEFKDPFEAEDVHKVDVYLQAFNLCEKIVVKALLVSKEIGDILLIHEVMNWANSCFYLTRKDTPIKNTLYKNIYSIDSYIPSIGTFAIIKEAFDISTSIIGSLKSNECFEYLVSYNSDNESNPTEKELLEKFSILSSGIDKLCKEGQHLTAYKILKTIGDILSIVLPEQSSILAFVNSILLNKCIPALIHGVTSANYIDTSLLYNLFLTSGKNCVKYVHHYMKMYRRQPKKLQELSVVGIMLLESHNETQGREQLLNSFMICKWWIKLQNVKGKIQYENFFKANESARLSQLIALGLIDVTMIKEYCEDFKIAIQTAYKEYLYSYLVNWKPTYDCKTDIDGNSVIIVNNTEDELRSKVNETIAYISDKIEAVKILEKCLRLVNFYHYEVFRCIYSTLKKFSDVPNFKTPDFLLLTFLQEYKRCSPPSQREKEEWYTISPESQLLDPLAEYRLPFIPILFTSDLWSIIRPEINLKSYKRWFNITNVLEHLKKDDICVYAIKEVVSGGILGDNMGKDWILYPKLEDLIQEVDECAKNISDLERATSAIYHLMYHTPNGADKVNVAHLSFNYASQYREQYPNSPDVENAYLKVKNKYYGYSAMHILHKFNLADEKYIQSVSQPESLVETLYMDERILKQVDSINLSCPDINAVVDAISKLFQLDIVKIRHSLFISWLTNSDLETDLDSTFAIPVRIVKSTNNVDEFDLNLKRAIYLCSCDSEFWIKHLIKVGLNEVEGEYPEQNSALFKSKVLKCLCAITDEDTIVKLTNLTYNEFLDYVDKVTLLCQLECLGICLNIETLDSYYKKDLLKRLRRMNNNLATKVMGSICMTYLIDENSYWQFIINNSIKFGMVDELKVYVKYLRNKYDRDYYISAWQTIVDHSFLQIDNEDNDIDELYINNFLMIQSSPVLFSLDFERIAKQCLQMKKFEFAAVLLQYLSEEKKQKYVTIILKITDIHLRLDELEKNGIWGVRNVKKWLGKFSN